MQGLQNLNVLLVEDDAELRGVLARWARWAGLRLDAAADGAAGLVLARAHDYDAVLFDLRMPGMDGPTFFWTLKRELPILARRAVAITGDASSEAALRFLAEARCYWVLKPFDLQDIAKVIGRAGAAAA